MVKILVVDDVADNRALLVTLILHRGYQPLEAADGAEALTLVRAERPSLVISDILMPTMDGYEFVRQLRADPLLAATEVIFYSAHYREREARNLAQTCGVTRVLVKPCEPEEILLAIDQALAHTPQPVPAPDLKEFDREHLRVMTDKLSEKMDKLRATNQRMAALTELNLYLASERDPQVLLHKVCRGARELMGAKYAVLCVEGKNGGGALVFTAGIEVTLLETLKQPQLDAGLLGQVRSERRARRIWRHNGNASVVGLPADYPSLHSCLVAPVMSLAHAYGWICLVDKLGADGFSDEDEQLVSVLSAQVGRIYENGSLYAEVRKHAEQLQVEVAERKRAAEELRASEAGLHRAQILAKLTHVVTGSDGVFESWPETMPQMIGRDPARMVRSIREWILLVHPEDRGLYRSKAMEAGDKGVRVELAYRLQRSDGAWLHIRQVVEPLFDHAAFYEHTRWFHTIQDVTEQRQAEEALRESNRRFSDMLGHMEMVSMMLDNAGHLTYCNDYLLRLTGWQREDALGRDWFERFIASPPEVGRARFRAMLTGQPGAQHFESEIRTRDDQRRLIRWNHTLLRSANGQVVGTASIGEDITDQRVAEQRIKRLNRVYAVLSGINTLIVRVRNHDELFREACRIAVEQGQFKMAWIGVADWEEMQIRPIASVGAEPEFLNYIKDRFSLREGSPLANSISVRAVIGKKAIVLNDMKDFSGSMYLKDRMDDNISSMAVLPLMVGETAVGLLALYADEPGFFDEEEMKLLTELAGDIGFALDHIEKADRLNYLAYYDEITGLPNRTLFLEYVSQHVRMYDGGRSSLALALIDIERFRVVNDTLGRATGDELLKLVAKRIQASGAGLETAARIGVNCFGVVIQGPRDVGRVALELEQLLRDCFAQPYHLQGSDVRIAGKIGVVLYPLDGEDAETLLRNAESALKRAKGSVDNLLFYAPEMDTRVAAALDLESRLRTAMDMEQFVLHYQPKVNLVTGEVTSAEALIRWNDPQNGLVPPGHFIPILEETGLIYEVGLWALRKALEDYKRWRAAGLEPVRIAVNVSPLQLRHRNFVTAIEQVVGADPLVAQGLELEVTESLIMEDVQRSTASLLAIRAMGVTIAIDDFGTGYSSLGHLSRLPVDTLKIDRSFVVDMVSGPQGLALVSSVINLAHAFKLKVVAEGVETQEQERLLRLMNCNEMQGFLFSRPVPVEVFEAKFLSAKAVPPATSP
ncbi:EAL domain-containing protein [Rhodoferax sp.]|uniref:EAL domain-containing protein n=1 Tax=Rhodoferax sp. TaxID=50421 RepID=UPI00374D24AA